MVNGRQLVPPYTIKTIGDPDKMEKSWTDGWCISKYQFTSSTWVWKRMKTCVRSEDDGTVIRTDKLTPVIPPVLLQYFIIRWQASIKCKFF